MLKFKPRSLPSCMIGGLLGGLLFLFGGILGFGDRAGEYSLASTFFAFVIWALFSFRPVYVDEENVEQGRIDSEPPDITT